MAESITVVAPVRGAIGTPQSTEMSLRDALGPVLTPRESRDAGAVLRECRPGEVPDVYSMFGPHLCIDRTPSWLRRWPR